MADPNAAQVGMKVGRDLLTQMARRMLLQGSNGFARFVTWVSLIGLVLGGWCADLGGQCDEWL